MHFVLIFGPPAVGKMTVGHELTKLTHYKLFHNHMTVEPVLDIFEFGSPPFDRLVSEFRTRIIEEAVRAELPGLVFTMVWGLELVDDLELISSYVDIVESAGGRVSFVELYAGQSERLERNTTEFRLSRKRSKQDLEFSRRNLLDLDDKYVMNTGEIPSLGQALLRERGFLRIDNSNLSAADAATQIVTTFAGTEPPNRRVDR